ncbi:MAG TPA: cupredoxin family copper-binding protein [Ktedonobacteraceae bacterium]|nr:cupredoxin family copper-binding protein [Ktedonobacteraceae bacterium]
MQKTRPFTISRALLCLLALCLVLLLVACGGTTAPTTSASTPTSTSTTSSTFPTVPTSVPSSAPTSAATSVPRTAPNNIAIAGFAFNPKTLTIKVGTKIIWTNDDPSIHTVTADNGAFNSGSLPPGGTFSFTFTKPGTYSYHCKIHSTMKATIIVQ